MEYLAIVAKMEQEDFNIIKNIAEEIGLSFILQHNPDNDEEVSEGITYFRERMDANIVAQLILSHKGKITTTTSTLLTEELQEFYVGGPSLLIDFIRKIDATKFNFHKFFLVFASEWKKEQRVRYLKCNFKDVENYFVQHNGWHLNLYSLDVFENFHETWCPLIFDIK